LLTFDTDEDKKNVIGIVRKFLSMVRFAYDSGGSESASQQAANRELKPMRGRVSALQKSWQVLSVAFAFSRLESLRDFSPLKRILISMDWAGVANKASPSHIGQGTTPQNNLKSDLYLLCVVDEVFQFLLFSVVIQSQFLWW
jgi:hypothetical protein